MTLLSQNPRVWCSCTIIDYLSGAERAKPECLKIIRQAEAGGTLIVVSAFAEAEVVKIDDPSGNAESIIRDFFARRYIRRAIIDQDVAREARRLVRQYGLKPGDAVHLATAVNWQIPVFETYDDKLLRLDGIVGQPRVTIRKPLGELLF